MYKNVYIPKRALLVLNKKKNIIKELIIPNNISSKKLKSLLESITPLSILYKS
jgi:hypothetical protein